MNKNVSHYISHLIEKTYKHNISLKLINKPVVTFDESGKQKVSGYFHSEEREIVCATKKPLKLWLSILVHETCHMDQWIENSKEWRNCYKRNGEDVGVLVDEWISGKIELSKEKISNYIGRVRDLELDCEKRSVEKIKEFNLPLDIDEYIQQANAYILFHMFMKKHRVWFRGSKFASKDPRIWKTLPKTFNLNYNSLPKDYERRVLKFCFDNKI